MHWVQSFAGKERVGSRKESLTPLQTIPPTGEIIKQLAYGTHHAARLMESGALYVDGDGAKGELGLGESITEAPTPQKVMDLPPIKQVVCGSLHTVALSQDGKVYSWGDGGSAFSAGGALGHGVKQTCFKPKLIEGLPSIVQIASGDMHCLALAESGEVFAWGRGEHGVLGTGSSSGALAPAQLIALANVKLKKIACGLNFSGALTTDGLIYLWGRNDRHQLAQSPGIAMDVHAMESLPMVVESLQQSNVQVTDMALGSHHTVVCTSTKQLYIWGMRKFQQPEIVQSAKEVIHIAAGNNFSAYIDRFGHLFTWGDGALGCLGHGDKSRVDNPQLVEGFGPVSRGNSFGAAEQVFASGKNIGVVSAM